jgi:hypothetical protein
MYIYWLYSSNWGPFNFGWQPITRYPKYSKSLKISEKFKDLHGLAQTFLNLGNVFQDNAFLLPFSAKFYLWQQK